MPHTVLGSEYEAELSLVGTHNMLGSHRGLRREKDRMRVRSQGYLWLLWEGCIRESKNSSPEPRKEEAGPGQKLRGWEKGAYWRVI